MKTAPALKWPEMPLADWRATYATLHMWSQIVGKTRLALAPMENHWWQVALYVTARGLTTSAMPYGDQSVEVQFDFISHQLLIQASDGSRHSIALTSMSVADFFARYIGALHQLGIDPATLCIAGGGCHSDPLCTGPRPCDLRCPRGTPMLVDSSQYTASNEGLSRHLHRKTKSGAFLLGQLRSREHTLFRTASAAASGRRAPLPGSGDGRSVLARMQQLRLLAGR